MKRTLSILVSIGLLAFFIHKAGGLGHLVRQMSELSLGAIVVVLLLNTLNRALMTYKWLRLLAYRDCHMRLVRGIQIYCASTIWGLFLPATVGADTVRATCTVREGISARETIASIAIERLVGALATPLLAVAGLLLIQLSGNFDPRLEPIWWVSLGVIAASLALLVVTFQEGFYQFLHHRLMGRFQRFKVFELLEKSHESFRTYRAAPGVLSKFFLLTLIENSFPTVVTWVIALGLGLSVPFIIVAAAVPLAYLVARVPFSIGGIGVYESVFVLVMAAGGVPVNESLAIAVLARLLGILAWVPWWLAYVLEGGRPDAAASGAPPR